MAQGQTGPLERSKSQSLCDYLSRWRYQQDPSVGARRWAKRATGWNLVLCRNNKASKQVSTCFLRFWFFLIWTIFQDFIEFVTIFLLLYVLVFWPRGTWHLSFPTRDQTCTPALDGNEVLTTGPPGKSWDYSFIKCPHGPGDYDKSQHLPSLMGEDPSYNFKL